MDYVEELKPLFATATNNGLKHAQGYLCGLMQTQSAHGKNMERMEEAVPDLDYQGLHHFMSHSPWSARLATVHAARSADGLLGGHPDTQLVIDESAFSKKGEKSVGVARQYNGRLGKVDNCQVGVFSALRCAGRATLTGFRLYLPENWCSDQARCKAAGIPEEERAFKSKSELALELVAEARREGVRFSCVGVDAGYGKDPAFLRALDDLGETFVADVHSVQRVWLENPWPSPPLPGATGRVSRHPRAASEPVTVKDWAATQLPAEWRAMVCREGSKGELRVEFLHARVYLWDREEEIPRLWHLLVRRTLDAAGQPHDESYTLSNAPADKKPAWIVAQACGRYFIERSFQDAKSQMGLGDYQLRGWLGWHHHMALVLLAMFFDLRERMLCAESVPLLSCADIVEMLAQFLPRRCTTKAEVLEQLQVRHKKRQSSIDSSRKKQVEKEIIHETI